MNATQFLKPTVESSPHIRASSLASILVLVALPSPLARAQSAPPDIIFTGQFITLDPSRPRVEALAVAGDRIIGAGSRAEVEALASKATRRIEFAGVAVPGLSDAHVHVSGLGEQLERLDLRGLTKEQILRKVAQAVRSIPPGEWLTGSGWDEGFFRPALFPTAADLDAVSSGHPVALSRIDGHSEWVNSKVLTLARISRSTGDPQGGRILRNSAGEPSGILVDLAQEAVNRVRPGPTRADQERRIRAALQQYARWGLTSVHDAGADLGTIAIYKELLKRGELPVRLYVMVRGDAAIAHYLANGPEIALGDGLLSIRSFKVISDGALGSRGAELTDPYADAPGERGLQLVDDASVDRLIQAAREKGFQVNVHAIGDRSIRRVLDAFERGGVKREERFRVEHASVIAPSDLPRFARLGIIASMQPVFVGEYSRWAEDRLGSTRVPWVLPIRSLLATGATIASGSDYPASDSGAAVATLRGLIARQSAEGKPPGGWYSDQRVDGEVALRLMTEGPAFAAFQEKDRGHLAEGRYADFTVLSANPCTVAPKDLETLAVRMTVVAGHIVFDTRRGQSASGPLL